MIKKKKMTSSIDIIETKKSKIPLKECMKNGTLPRFPFSIMISGRSGSGKTNLLLNLLTRDDYYGNYFDGIIVFSPTAGQFDDQYDVLKLPKSNYMSDFGPDVLNKIINVRKKLIKKYGIEHVAKKYKLCIILDDIIANRDFLESQEALKMFALLRHYLVSVIVLIQSYNKLPRALRLNCNGIFVFPSLASEKKVLIDEITPSSISKKTFAKIFDYCTEGQYDFLFINNHSKPNEKIRKNFNIVDIEDFK